jgi:hypothetical protein
MASFYGDTNVFAVCFEDTATYLENRVLEQFAVPIYKDRIVLWDSKVTADTFLEYVQEHQGEIRDEYYTRIQLLFDDETETNSLRLELKQYFLTDYEQNLRYRGQTFDTSLHDSILSPFLEKWVTETLGKFYKFLVESFETDMALFMTGGLVSSADGTMDADFDLLEKRVEFWIEANLSDEESEMDDESDSVNSEESD